MPVVVQTRRKEAQSFSHDFLHAPTLRPSLDVLRRLENSTIDIQNEDDQETVMRRAFQMDLLSAAPVAARPRRRIRFFRSHQVEDFDGADADQEYEPPRNGWRECRQVVYEILTDPSSSWLAWVTSILMITLVLLSSATFCIETLPNLSNEATYFLGIVEWVSVLSFSVEYVLKLASSPNLWEAIKDPFNIIDLLSIVPFYVSLSIDPQSTMPWVDAVEDYDEQQSAGADTRIIRIVRLVRVFRVLKLGKRISKVEVIITSVLESWDMLVMLVFLLMMATIICSALIYYAENDWWNHQIASDTVDLSLLGPDGDQNPFGSIPECFWWCIVTLMTVGYGDVVPQTPLGKLVACFAMLVSIVIMALPISVIGAAFTQHWTAYKSQEGALERTQRVLPCCKDTRRALSKHNTVLEDFVATLHSLKQRVDGAMVSFRQDSERFIEVAEDPNNQMDPRQQESFVGMRRTPSFTNGVEYTTERRQTCQSGFIANRSWKILNDLQQLSTMTQSDVAKIERAHFAYKGLKKWYDEGSVLKREIEDLLGNELKEVQSFLQDQVRPSQRDLGASGSAGGVNLIGVGLDHGGIAR